MTKITAQILSEKLDVKKNTIISWFSSKGKRLDNIDHVFECIKYYLLKNHKKKDKGAYSIIKETNIHEMSSSVRDAVQKGWIPIGSPFRERDEWLQAIYKQSLDY